MRGIKADFCGETDVGHSNPRRANQKQNGQMVAGEDVHGVISPTGLAIVSPVGLKGARPSRARMLASRPHR